MLNSLRRIYVDKALSRMNEERGFMERQVEELVKYQFHLAMRDRQLTREESDKLLELILNLAAMRALALLRSDNGADKS